MAGLGPLLLLAATALVSGAAADEAPEGPSPDALLARGVSNNRSSEVRQGLEQLRAAVAARPDHALSRSSLAVALLRAGLFADAEREFARLLGEDRARALAGGRLTQENLGPDTDPESLLGLATSIHLQGGRTRECERLYRIYAEHVGPLSTEAARAYMRLRELAEDGDAEWIDADAELAKAAAVNPSYETLMLMPRLIDPRDYAELEPYLRPIELVPILGDSGAADPAADFDSLPSLSLWVSPSDSTRASAALVEGLLQLEILVGSDGVPRTVEPVPVPEGEELEPLKDTVMQWRFSPAVSGGERVAAAIFFGDVSRDEWSYVGPEAEKETPGD